MRPLLSVSALFVIAACSSPAPASSPTVVLPPTVAVVQQDATAVPTLAPTTTPIPSLAPTARPTPIATNTPAPRPSPTVDTNYRGLVMSLELTLGFMITGYQMPKPDASSINDFYTRFNLAADEIAQDLKDDPSAYSATVQSVIETVRSDHTNVAVLQTQHARLVALKQR